MTFPDLPCGVGQALTMLRAHSFLLDTAARSGGGTVTMMRSWTDWRVYVVLREVGSPSLVTLMGNGAGGWSQIQAQSYAGPVLAAEAAAALWLKVRRGQG